jgi:hypothetical protein
MSGRHFADTAEVQMPNITLPVPYTINATKGGGKAQKKQNFAGVDTCEFSIVEHSHQDVVVVGRWRQRFGPTTPFTDKPTVADHDGWRQHFEADGAFNQMILIDGKLYSPLRSLDREGEVLVTFDRFRDLVQAGPDDRRFISAGALGLTHFGGYGYRQQIAKTSYLESGLQPSEQSTEGWKRQNDTREREVWNMKVALGRVAVVDGMIWEQVAEPVITVEVKNDGAASLYLQGESDYFNPLTRFAFSLCDYDFANQFFEDNFTDLQRMRYVNDVVVEAPQALKSSREALELRRSIDAFMTSIETYLPDLSRSTGLSWHKAKGLLGPELAGRYGEVGKGVVMSEFDPEVVDEVVGLMTVIAERLGREIDRQADVAKIRLLAKLNADRWAMRPLEAQNGMGM